MNNQAIDELQAEHIEVLRDGIATLIDDRKRAFAQLERLRARAQMGEIADADDLLLFFEQSDQRLIDQGERMLETLNARLGDRPAAERAIDETSSESFPASDPPSFSGTT